MFKQLTEEAAMRRKEEALRAKTYRAAEELAKNSATLISQPLRALQESPSKHSEAKSLDNGYL